jgi:4-amino-4-deoxychorismate lyase
LESALREGSGEPGLRLIETMLWDGESFPRGHLHAERAARSAAALGWPSPVPAIERALHVQPRGVAQRLRLSFDSKGRVQLEIMPLIPTSPPWRVGLATERLSSDDPWLRHKTSRRGAYDRARAALPEGLDEVLFVNERGEVCDGSITTVFFRRKRGWFGLGQRMCTPPLSSGLLPGVLRAEMACKEEVLMAEDLPKVQLWVGNSVRGLIPAVFQA